MSRQPFDRDQIHELLDELAAELRDRNAHGNLYIIGGSALALAYDGGRETYDIDALIRGDHGEVIRAIRSISLRRGLPSTWMNEQATPFLPRTRDINAQQVYSHPHLTVTAASREHLIAMKLNSKRPNDLADLQHLIDSSPTRLTATHLKDLVSTLYDPDQIDVDISKRIAAVDVPEPPGNEPPSLGL